MAIVSVKKIFEGRDADYSVGKAQRIRRYTRVWRVITDDREDEGPTILAALPPIGSIYSAADPAAWLRHLHPSNASFSPYVWICTGAYSSEFEVKENPLEEPAKITWKTQNFRRPYTKDRENKAILNSAGDPFDPPIEGDDSRWQCTIQKNVAAVPIVVLTYKDAINEAAFTVRGVEFPERTAKIMSMEISDTQRAGDADNPIEFYSFTWSFAGDPDNWDLEILDAGMRELNDNDKLQRIYNDDGQPVHSPVPLDGAGAKLENPNPDTAVFIDGKIYKKKDFSVLPRS